jgi:hypothetical protein
MGGLVQRLAQDVLCIPPGQLQDRHGHLLQLGDDGIDGGAEIREADFRAVRGTLDDNAFIKGLREDTGVAQEKGARLVGRLKNAV